MNIALVTQYFWPEQFIINDLVKELTEQGHSIYVLTGKPNYSDGEVFPGYTSDSTMTEEYIPGVDVFRAPLRPRGQKGAKNLFLNYLSFIVNGIKYFPKAIKGRTIDVILVFGLSPITSAIPAINLKRHTKAHMVIWIQDLWPDSLKATGYVKNRFLLWLVECMVRSIYYCSDTLLVQSRGFINKVKKLAKSDKIFYYPNSFVQEYNALAKNDPSLLELINQLENNKCFVFAGNLGTVQALDMLLDATKKLSLLDNFKLVLVGGGAREEHLRQRIKKENIEHVIFAGRYAMELMPEIFSRAAALIVSLTNEELFSCTIPSKIQAYLAAGRPIIAAINGEGAKIVKEAGAGLVCPAEDVDGLVTCMRTVYCMSEMERNALGKSGREYFMEHFEMKSQALRLIDLLNQRLRITT
jgi:glycosyltransferase involved in cell wall biosynthesis